MTAATHGSHAEPTTDADAAAAFLAEQADCLLTGLAHADDPLAVRAVLHSHDGGHGRWLQLIASAAVRDPAAAEQLGTLYELHGRVAGCLERGMRQLPAPDLKGHVGALLAGQLRSCTERTVAALRTP